MKLLNFLVFPMEHSLAWKWVWGQGVTASCIIELLKTKQICTGTDMQVCYKQNRRDRDSRQRQRKRERKEAGKEDRKDGQTH